MNLIKYPNVFRALKRGGVILICLFLFTPISAVELEITFELPEIKTSKYRRPFVAVWLERKSDRSDNQTVAIWYDDKKWLKDIRKWWRKAGRYQDSLDGFSGATRPAGRYTVTVSLDASQEGPDNEYLVYFEAVREHGNRSLLKQTINLSKTFPQTYEIKQGQEIGPGLITIKELEE